MGFDDVVCAEHAFDVQFHPTEPIVATAQVTGSVHLHALDVATGKNAEVLAVEAHKESCRAARFLSGDHLVSCSADGSLVALDRSGKKVWRANAGEALNTLVALDPHCFAAGSDEGAVHLFDLRQKSVVAKLHEQEDFVADLASHDKFLLAASGDGTLCAYDLRARKLEALSDRQDDERLAVAVCKDGDKVVVGTQGGVLEIFRFGYFGDLNDRLPGLPQSIDTLAKFDEQTLLAGSSDGVIRIVSIFPNRVIGALGEHGEDFPIEQLALNADKSLCASVSHDQHVKFWDTSAIRSGPPPTGKPKKEPKPDPKKVLTAGFFADI